MFSLLRGSARVGALALVAGVVLPIAARSLKPRLPSWTTRPSSPYSTPQIHMTLQPAHWLKSGPSRRTPTNSVRCCSAIIALYASRVAILQNHLA